MHSKYNVFPWPFVHASPAATEETGQIAAHLPENFVVNIIAKE